MDWLILLVLIPSVAISIVLFAGFAGCSFQPGAAYKPVAPSDLTATAVSSTEIDLTWTSNDPAATGFRIYRSENGGAQLPLTPDLNFPAVSKSDTGLNPDTPYEYQVFAFSFGTESDGSNLASARTQTAQGLPVAYSAPITTDDSPFGGSTLVQLIPSSRLTASATKIRITLRGASAANLIIDAVFVSQGATAGKVWDPGPDLTEVRSGGSSGVTIPAGQAKAMDDTAYALDPSKNLMVAFNIHVGSDTVGRAAVATAGMYSLANSAEAGTSPRSNNYATHLNSVYILEKIEVVA